MSGKQRNIRKRRALDEQEELSEDEAQGLSVQDTKLLQKQRQRKTVSLRAHASSSAARAGGAHPAPCPQSAGRGRHAAGRG